MLASSTADESRRDVEDAGFGDGNYGFTLNLSRDVNDGLNHELEITVELPGGMLEVLTKVQCVFADIVAPPSQPVESPLPRSNSEAVTKLQNASQVDRARSRYLEQALLSALARVDELEQRERQISAHRDRLSDELTMFKRDTERQVQIQSQAPFVYQNKDHLEIWTDTLSATARRDRWLTVLSSLGIEGGLFGLFPHDGVGDGLTIMIVGSGGIGDALYLSAVVRALGVMFPQANLFLGHANSKIKEIFKNNPFVTDAISLDYKAMTTLLATVHSLDIFDLVVDVRYVVNYTMPPKSRAPLDFVRQASYRAAEWQRYIRYRWPHLNNAFSNEVTARGMSKYDIMGYTGNIEVDRYSELDFFVNQCDEPLIQDLLGKRYITIHHGADKKMSDGNGIQTKNLPNSTWGLICGLLRQANYTVVQLGEEHEHLVSGVDVDLRGKLDLNGAAYVLKHADVHIDTEGGLVHMARAMHTVSVVAFGPTPAPFFGYPQNENIEATICNNCWWLANDWSSRCVRGNETNECMTSHSAERIVDTALRLIQPLRSLSLVQSDAKLDSLRDTWRRSSGNGGVVIASLQSVDDIRKHLPLPPRTSLYVPVEIFNDVRGNLADECDIRPHGGLYIPRNSDSLDWVAIHADSLADDLWPTIEEALRCVKDPGQVHIVLPPDTNWREQAVGALEAAQDRAIGLRYYFTVSEDTMGKKNSKKGDNSVILTFRPQQ
ncbi:glycosyltransferase family 9 protein [Nitrospirillum iridis]|uniref:ADP-heptose:LPS heptosyltransferase n=1 Tax=Nitrospirillum iridis TaxID=765888 RepID=A0A7X0B329_9PROT|nr:glycosyltransferase family 9 protein [Nitrospirillum iridis]MBB6253810.1 ADP-heptose:LPS heptosyltransferase [Nitrospirillum iridis]